MNNWKNIILALACCLTGTHADATAAAVTRARADSALSVLWEESSRTEAYTRQKAERASVLKEALRSRRDVRERYAACRDLYEEYKVHQYDSAFVYARLALTLAAGLGDPREIVAARCRMADCYTNGGYFKEASDECSTVDVAGLDSAEMGTYYKSVAFLFQNMYMYVQGNAQLSAVYEREQHRYYALSLGADTAAAGVSRGYMRDSRHVSPRDLEWHIAHVATLRQPSHDAAVEYYIIGEMCQRLGRHDEAVYYTAMSAINDVRTATHETAATRLLADLLFADGRIELALRCIRLAQDDAEFYHSRLRQVEIARVLPAIERSYYDMVGRHRRLWIAATALALLLAAALAVLIVKLYRSHRRLEQMSRKSHDRGVALAEANTKLEALNARLGEANAVKYQFIVQSLYSDSDFADRVERQAKAIAVKLRARQYADIDALLHAMDVKGERERMSAVFDKTFLRLYPTFVDEYNSLFPPGHQATLDKNGAMPTEMRIFALQRLGISDTRQVGRYLNLTTNSIYVYRAKAKAAALVGKDEFEVKIMQIGL